MKKLILILISIFFLTGCSEEKVDILESVLKHTYIDKNSFQFNHSFTFDYSIKDGEYETSKSYSFDEVIDYSKKDYSNVVTTKTEKDNILGKEYEKNVDYETYLNYLTNDGYFKRGDTFYNVKLSKLVNLGMNSIDPFLLINTLLFENEGLYFKGENSTVVKDEEDYKKIVSTLSKEDFLNITSSFTGLLNQLPNDYLIIATSSFNDNFEITNIEFDFTDFIQKYNYYFEFEKNIEVEELDATYNIEISSYNKKIDFLVDDYETIYSNGNEDKFIHTSKTDFTDPITIADVKSNYSYDNETELYTIASFFELKEDIKYFYFDILYYSGNDLVKISSLDHNDLLYGESVYLDFYETNEEITDVYIDYYYMKDAYSSLIRKKSVIKFEYLGPANISELNRDVFNEYTTDFIDSTYIVEKNGKYLMDFNLLTNKVLRNLDYTIFLINDTNKKTIYDNNLNFEDSYLLRIEEELDFVPTSGYLYIRYNINSTTMVERKITLELNDLSNAKFTEYEENSTKARLDVDSNFNTDFSSTTYTVGVSTTDYIPRYLVKMYFVTDDRIIDSTILYTNDSLINNHFSHTVYNPKVDMIYTDIVYNLSSTKPTASIKYANNLNT